MNKSLSYIFPKPPKGLDPTALDEGNIPVHVAVIMDGNGRWAKQRALNRLRGHKAGIEAVRETIRCASDLGIKYLTIYSFSTENWKRPKEEVEGLMDLFAKTMLAEVDELHKEGVRVCTIGDLSPLPHDTRQAFDSAWEKTRDNKGMTLVVAINYGARQEILQAVQACVDNALRISHTSGEKSGVVAGGETSGVGSEKLGPGASAAVAKGADVAEIAGENALIVTQDMFESHLQTAHIPDPDLVIRTSGELRMSNFLLWQAAYAEFYCTEVLWPDFNRYDFLRALLQYQARERRFGAL